jgi:hypothetical protein
MSGDSVLAFVNHVRRSSGLPAIARLEAGMRQRPRDCALARTIGGGARVMLRHTELFGHRYRHPRSVVRWLRRFDRGKYPELTTVRPTISTIWHLDFEPTRAEPWVAELLARA